MNTYGQSVVAKLLADIQAQREEICRAFIAKYGCHPDELEQIEEIHNTRRVWYVRKRVKPREYVQNYRWERVDNQPDGRRTLRWVPSSVSVFENGIEVYRL